MTYRRPFLAVTCTALVLGLAWGCAAADGVNASLPSSGGDNGIFDGGNDEQVISLTPTPDPEGGIVLNQLCGKYPRPRCVPDSPPNTCAKFVPPSVPDGSMNSEAGMSSDASMGPDASMSPDASGLAQSGASGEGGTAGAGAPSSMSRAGASGAAGDTAGAGGVMSVGGAAGAAGVSGEGGGAGAAPIVAAVFGCQVQRIAGSSSVVTSECAVVGSGGDNAPCLTSADCSAGFGCVGDQNGALCQAYCCESADNCKPGKYCAERPLRDAVVNELPIGSTEASRAPLIPVCVPAENCDLSAPFPCTGGTQCACQSGSACLVVRADGTTTCAVPGAGKVGDACPCAWGHVCSAARNQCLQLCYTRGPASCGDGKCQSASDLPDGWGVCVGANPSGG